MSNYFLVTTPLEETWDKNKKIFFLGEWCKQIHRKNFWEKLDTTTQPYYCDNKEKLKNNFSYCRDLYDDVINKLSKDLNFYHKTSYSDRYWKIILGPWLRFFISSVFERYQNVDQLHKNEIKYETIILKIDKNILIPRTHEEFLRLLMSNTWNHFIYSEIIKRINNPDKIKIREKEFNDTENFEGYLQIPTYSKIGTLYNFFISFFKKKTKDEKFFITESYLSFFEELRLNVQLRTLPKYNNFKFPKQKNIDNEKRQGNLLKDFNPKNEFENILCDLIKIQLPKSFFENYKEIQKSVSNIDWPTRPSVIFSSHLLNKTIKSFYTAEKVEKFGTKLVYGQHGGGYGQFDIYDVIDHELDVSDKFLSWGWSDPGNKKIVALGIIKDISQIQYNKKNDRILLIVKGYSRYRYEFNSDLFSGQMQDYFEECVQFCKKINSNIVDNKLTIRLHAKRFWNEDLIFKNELPKAHIDKGYRSVHKLIANCKLVVHSYVATGYLETLAANFPTLIFTNINYYLLNKETMEGIKILTDAQIFHSNYESAANFINKNYENIDVWWNSEKTQKARSLFCKKYANLNKDKVNTLIKILRSCQQEN